MIDDLGKEQQPITEQRSPGGYVRLVYDNDQAENLTEEGFEFIIFPKKSIGNVGQTNVRLSRNIIPTEPSKAIDLYLSADGLTPIGKEEAVDMGLYELDVWLGNVSARFRGSLFSVHISIGGQEELIEGALENETEGAENIKKYKGDFTEV